MSRFLTSALVVLSLAFVVSCGSKEKSADDADAQAAVGEPGGDVSEKAIGFDPEGSDSGNITGLNTVNFAYDKASLSSKARKQLADNANWIRENSNVTVQIEGHCDSRGSVEYNLALGERRAQAVKDYLVNLGVDSQRLTIISYGKEKPLAYGDSESDHAKNRRANFVPLPQ